MSTPAQGGGQKSGIGLGLGLLLGCGGGCLLVVVAIVGLVALMSAGAIGQFKEMEKKAEQQRETRRSIAGLDAAHPPRIPEDLAEAELDASDIDAYLVAWRAVETPLVEREQLEQRLEETIGGFERGKEPDLGEIFGVMRDMQGAVMNAAALEGAVPTALHDGLAAAGLGPTDFRRLLEIIEWRFLGNARAAPLALGDETAAALRGARTNVERIEGLLARPDLPVGMARIWIEEDVPEGATEADVRRLMEKSLEESRQRLATILEEAAATRTLHPKTEAVLETRREALEGRADVELEPILSELSMARDASEADPSAAVEAASQEAGGAEPTTLEPATATD